MFVRFPLIYSNFLHCIVPSWIVTCWSFVLRPLWCPDLNVTLTENAQNLTRGKVQCRHDWPPHPQLKISNFKFGLGMERWPTPPNLTKNLKFRIWPGHGKKIDPLIKNENFRFGLNIKRWGEYYTKDRLPMRVTL